MVRCCPDFSDRGFLEEFCRGNEGLALCALACVGRRTLCVLHADDPRALRLCAWPIPRPDDWLTRVNQPLTSSEIDALRKCTERGRPYGSRSWVEQTAEKTGLQCTLRSEG